MKTYRVHIEGCVQGVGFRYDTQEKASQLEIQGWVRNCSDGTVETLIYGRENQLNAMLEWLKHGPSSAKVSQIHIQAIHTEQAPSGFTITD